jgi:hypothetical protein
MGNYEETEERAISENKKRLHYERIRLQEDRAEIESILEQVE